jgi:hypothetical protein
MQHENGQRKGAAPPRNSPANPKPPMPGGVCRCYQNAGVISP